MPDLGVQQLPWKQSAKPSAVVWVPQHEAPDVFRQLCHGLADACRTSVHVEWWPQASSLPFAASFPTTSETAV